MDRSRTGANCTNITTGRGCRFDIGNGSSNIHLGDYNQKVKIGDGCENIHMGGYIVNSTFGNGCMNVVFGTNKYNTQSYFRGIDIGTRTSNINLYYNGADDREQNDVQYVQYVDVAGFNDSDPVVNIKINEFAQTRQTSIRPADDDKTPAVLKYPSASGTIAITSDLDQYASNIEAAASTVM